MVANFLENASERILKLANINCCSLLNTRTGVQCLLSDCVDRPSASIMISNRSLAAGQHPHSDQYRYSVLGGLVAMHSRL